jgi:N-acetyltransferase B complex (NatB) non catalytic subunit
VQRILSEDIIKTNTILAVHILETAIRYSPHNAYLKIAAILCYSKLDATSRCWDLYSELYIKHVQHESCSFLILNVLRSGGFYRETINVCQDILGLQRTSTREAGDFTGRAMENGSIGKADEFLSFHRKRMFKSLTTLEAKGLILDCAPMFIQDEKQCSVGSVHGVVGGESDLERVKQMIAEAHNPSGAFSLLRLKGAVHDNINDFSDNRDFGTMSFEILHKTSFDSSDLILSESIRRGCHHNLLIRAALCVDATKGPKKGKVVKASQEAEHRCKSLLRAIDVANESVVEATQPTGYVALLDTMKHLCKALVAIGLGMDSQSQVAYTSIEDRESAGVTLLQQTDESLKNARTKLALRDDLSISRTSRLLPDCIVPVFSLFQMNAKIADLFGWGKRKRKTKRIAASLADVALSFVTLLDDMSACVGYLHESNMCSIEAPSDLIDPSSFQETYEQVMKAQLITRERIETILDYIRKCLLSFDVDK